MFPLPEDREITSNILSLCLQPDEGLHLRFEAKVPDTPADMRSVNMEFHYADSFGCSSIPDAYERLLLDALSGDPSLFTRADQIELAWKLIDPVIEGWRQPDAPPLALYDPESWGPPEADEFLQKDHRFWLLSCEEHG
jgi:glucose-6-phosphate 1-dehydrogenase